MAIGRIITVGWLNKKGVPFPKVRGCGFDLQTALTAASESNVTKQKACRHLEQVDTCLKSLAFETTGHLL